jgi:hypothetical protein
LLPVAVHVTLHLPTQGLGQFLADRSALGLGFIEPDLQGPNLGPELLGLGAKIP